MKPPRIKPVYYRMYSRSGAFKVRSPCDPEDPFVGRTLATHVTPPHSSKNVQLHLSSLEGIQDDGLTSLCADIFAASLIDDATVIDFKNPDGVGSSQANPVAFITAERPESSQSTDIPRRAGFQYTLKALVDCEVAIFAILPIY